MLTICLIARFAGLGRAGARLLTNGVNEHLKL